MSIAHHQVHYVSNRCGWELELKQCRPPQRIHKKRNPLVIIPGYGMNSFIFGFHPRGLSMEEYFREKGFEVWSVNLRGQGHSRGRKKGNFGMGDLSLIDLKIALDYISKTSASETGKVDLIGCSLGGTLAFIYSALIPDQRAGALVAVGAPLRWEERHWLLKTVFAFPGLVGKIPMWQAKRLLKLFLPLAMRSPLMKIYLHKEIVDLRHADPLLETVESPNRRINREIASWIRNKDLVINGKNLSHELHKVKNPVLCVVANSDGIVPSMTALSALELVGSRIKETLVVGTEDLRFAHADLFVSNYCHEMVFRPVADWLLKVGSV